MGSDCPETDSVWSPDLQAFPSRVEVFEIFITPIAASGVPIDKTENIWRPLFISGQCATDVAWSRNSALPSSSMTIPTSRSLRGWRSAACSSDVETLSSPAELLPLLRKDTPDAILLDLNFQRGATDGREGLNFLGKS